MQLTSNDRSWWVLCYHPPDVLGLPLLQDVPADTNELGLCVSLSVGELPTEDYKKLFE